MKFFLITFAIIALLPAQTEWVAVYPGNCKPKQIVVNGDTTYVVGEFGEIAEDSICVLSYNGEGKPLWKTTVRGINALGEYFISANGNGVFVLGQTKSSDRLILARLSEKGAIVWRNEYDLMVSSSLVSKSAQALLLTHRGVYCAVYQSYMMRGGQDCFEIFKIGFDGKMEWMTTYRPADMRMGELYALSMDAKQNIFVAGSYDGDTDRKERGLLFSLAANGRFMRAATYGAFYKNRFSAVTSDSIGNVYVAGYGGELSPEGNAYFLHKYSPHGQLLWEGKFDVTNGEAGSPKKVVFNGDDILIKGWEMRDKRVALYTAPFTSSGQKKEEATKVFVSRMDRLVDIYPSENAVFMTGSKFDKDGYSMDIVVERKKF